MFFNNNAPTTAPAADNSAEMQSVKEKREIMLQKLRRQELEDDYIEIEVEDSNSMNDMLASMGMDDSNGNLGDMFNNFMPKKMKKRKVTVSDRPAAFRA